MIKNVTPLSREIYAVSTAVVPKLDRSAFKAICAFIASQQNPDGGFAGKEGKSDLYYTLFGLMCAAVLNLKIDLNAVQRYLNEQENSPQDLVHLSALIRARLALKLLSIPDNLRMLVSNINPLRRFYVDNRSRERLKIYLTSPDPDRFPHQDPNCPYSLLLAVGAAQDCGMDFDAGEFLTRLTPYRTPDGAWSNLKNSASGSLNATIAAIQVKRQLTGTTDPETLRWLRTQQNSDGGFRAVPNAPSGDLLSTATALFALRQGKTAPAYVTNDFIRSLWHPNGGFCATVTDNQPDCEYTFYGLLAGGSLL